MSSPPPQPAVVHVTTARSRLEEKITSDGVSQWSVRPTSQMVTDTERQRFEELANEWLRETRFDSDPVDKFLHPSHFKIVGMGPRILPLLLKEAEKMSGHWFVALNAVSPVNPVPPEYEVSLEATTHAWLDWGKREGLIA